MAWHGMIYTHDCIPLARLRGVPFHWRAEFVDPNNLDSCPACGCDDIRPISATRLPDHDGWRLDGDYWWVRPAREGDERRMRDVDGCAFIEDGWLYTTEPDYRDVLDGKGRAA